MTERYTVNGYYIFDNVERCQVITFDRLSEPQAKDVCKLLNEHEVMKNFLVNIGKAIMEA